MARSNAALANTIVAAVPTQALNPDGYSRAAQVASLFGICEATLWRWSRESRCPAPTRLSAGVTAFRNRDLLDWSADPAGWTERNGGPKAIPAVRLPASRTTRRNASMRSVRA